MVGTKTKIGTEVWKLIRDDVKSNDSLIGFVAFTIIGATLAIAGIKAIFEAGAPSPRGSFDAPQQQTSPANIANSTFLRK